MGGKGVIPSLSYQRTSMRFLTEQELHSPGRSGSHAEEGRVLIRAEWPGIRREVGTAERIPAGRDLSSREPAEEAPKRSRALRKMWEIATCGKPEN